jgi:hypothetical protein
MLRPSVATWNQSVDDLRRLAIGSAHPRTRERFQALFMIASGAANASGWATRIGREDETVMGWVHLYNAAGPQAMTYRRRGGTPPFCPPIGSQRSSRLSPAPCP